MSDISSSDQVWIFHYFVDDLKLIVGEELPRVAHDCTVDERRQIRTLVEAFRHFCSVESDPPQLSEPSPLAADASPGQRLIHDFTDYCCKLAREWKGLDRSSRRRLRSSLARAFKASGETTPAEPVHRGELYLCGLVVMVWVVLFAVGYSVHAGPYQEVLKEPRISVGGAPEMLVFIGALFMFILTSIPTNVLLLACLTGVLGTAYRRATGHREDARSRSRAHDYLCSLTTAFFVYLILIGGLLSLSVAEVLTYETQEKYLKLAGSVSMFAFLVGYDRHIVAWMLRRVATFLTQSEVPAYPTTDQASQETQPSAPKALPASQTAIIPAPTTSVSHTIDK